MTDQPQTRVLFPRLRMSGIDLRRIAFLVLAASELSEGGYVLMRYARNQHGKNEEERNDHWRINVRFAEMEHTSTARVPLSGRNAPQRWQGLLLCLDRAVQWLRTAKARVELPASEDTSRTQSS